MSKIEQEFYETFEIEKQYQIFEDDYGKYQSHDEIYPLITSDILLEMICLLNEYVSISNWKQLKYISTFEIETLKENILKDLIYVLNNECNDITRNQLKQQVQQIFKD